MWSPPSGESVIELHCLADAHVPVAVLTSLGQNKRFPSISGRNDGRSKRRLLIIPRALGNNTQLPRCSASSLSQKNIETKTCTPESTCFHPSECRSTVHPRSLTNNLKSTGYRRAWPENQRLKNRSTASSPTFFSSCLIYEASFAPLQTRLKY